jgi:hypothetical protein
MSRTSLLVVLAVAFLVPNVATAQNAALAKQIEANERAVQDAVAKGDAAAFNKLVAADGMSLEGSGPMPVSEFVKMLPQVKVASWAIDQVKVTPINDTTAVITYRWTGKGTMMGQAFPSPVFASTVWANKAGKWMAVFHQETIATPPPPPAKK